MSKLLFISFLLIMHGSSLAQVSDIIAIKKKNGKLVKNFFQGFPILFQTKDGDYVEGPIDKIHGDTVYIRMYDIEKMATSLGSYVNDTVNTFLIGTNYHDIKRISVYKGRGSIRQKVGILMMVAGAGYAILNLLNGAFFNLPVTDPENLKKLGISAGLVAIGFINNKF